MPGIGFHHDEYVAAPQELRHAWMISGSGVRAIQLAAEGLGAMAPAFTTHVETMRDGLRKLGVDWSGQAAANATASLHAAARWAEQAGRTSSTGRGSVETYGRSFGDTAARIHPPEPVPDFSVIDHVRKFFDVQTDQDRVLQRNQDGAANAIRALDQHEQVARMALTSFPDQVSAEPARTTGAGAPPPTGPLADGPVGGGQPGGGHPGGGPPGGGQPATAASTGPPIPGHPGVPGPHPGGPGTATPPHGNQPAPAPPPTHTAVAAPAPANGYPGPPGSAPTGSGPFRGPPPAGPPPASLFPGRGTPDRPGGLATGLGAPASARPAAGAAEPPLPNRAGGAEAAARPAPVHPPPPPPPRPGMASMPPMLGGALPGGTDREHRNNVFIPSDEPFAARLDDDVIPPVLGIEEPRW